MGQPNANGGRSAKQVAKNVAQSTAKLIRTTVFTFPSVLFVCGMIVMSTEVVASINSGSMVEAAGYAVALLSFGMLTAYHAVQPEELI